MNFNSIEEAIKDIKKGKVVIAIDDEDKRMKVLCCRSRNGNSRNGEFYGYSWKRSYMQFIPEKDVRIRLDLMIGKNTSK